MNLGVGAQVSPKQLSVSTSVSLQALQVFLSFHIDAPDTLAVSEYRAQQVPPEVSKWEDSHANLK